ncbi:excalibur calcium-binding domain-containing protein [Streptomyces sp. NPDC001594]|uniref:excalibur calcium-binding domain-containing protein n=1 Tax=Streptomyces sp. NPDC001594 TaxID=3364590 RepID=UPI0036744679
MPGRAGDPPLAVGRAQGEGQRFLPELHAVGEVGAAPICRGDPGYGAHLDRDGVVCE